MAQKYEFLLIPALFLLCRSGLVKSKVLAFPELYSPFSFIDFIEI